MKNITLLLFLTLGTISSYAQSIIDGLWFVTTNEAARSQCESGNNDYEISVCFTGSESFEGTISFSFDPAKFTLTDAGAFSLVSPGSLKLENITAYLHSPKCYAFRGKKTVLSPLFSCSLVGTSNFNLPYNAQTSIATPLFKAINGGSGTNISQFYPPNGTQLLAPQDAALQPQYVRFNGKVIIDNNYTFYDDSEIAMEQNAQIEIAEISKNSITTKNGALILSGRDNTTASIKENILTQAGGFTSATVRLGEFIGGGPYSTNEWSFTKNKITGFGNTSTFYAANFERLQIYNQNEIKHSSSLKPGIRIDGGYQNKVQCNKSIEGKTGVLFNGSYLSRIDCNDLIKGSDAAVQILGNCEKTRIRGNALNGTYTDLKYGETTAGYSYTGSQEYHRNLFLGSHTSDYNAINYESSDILALKSQFLVKTGMHYPCPDIDGLMGCY